MFSLLQTCSEPPPCIGHEQHQHGEDLQTAGQHIEDQHQLCGVCKAAEVLHGTNLDKTRTDVVQGSSHGGKVRHHIKAVQADEEEGGCKDKDIRRNEHVGGADSLVVTRAKFLRFSSLLMTELLPTLDLPAKTICGRLSNGKSLSLTAERRNSTL